MTGGGWNWILIISKDGLKMCLVESSKCDNSLKCTWMLSHVELEGGGAEESVHFSKFNCLSGENEETCDKT